MNRRHLQTILWLRWRLTRNQLERSNALNKVFTMVILIGGLVASVAAGVGGILGGSLGLAHAPGWTQLLVWDLIVAGFLFFWTFSLLVEIQRSETVDMTRLLHLPVSLRQVFFLNYLASHLTPILVVIGPGLVGLALGVTVVRGPVGGLLLLLVVSFVFMVTSWTYCLRGWLARLMINKRRRRAIIVGLTMSFILLSQLPNLYFNMFPKRQSRPPQEPLLEHLQNRERPKTDLLALLESPSFSRAHFGVPFLWLPAGARSLAEDRPWPAVLVLLGQCLLGWAGLRRAYASTLKFYQGSQDAPKPGPAPPRPSRAAAKASFLERRLPGLPDHVSALALATFRNLLRAPEAKMALVFPFIMVVVFGTLFMRNTSEHLAILNPFVPASLVLFLLFGLVQIAMNQFGFDRSGFRSLVLAPVARRDLLWSKNLATLGLTLPLFLLLLLGLLVTGRISWDLMLAGLLQFLAGFILLSLLGNWASILAPYRMAMGSLRRNKTRSTVTLVMLAFTMAFPLVMLPVLIPSLVQAVVHSFGLATQIPFSLLVSIPLLAGAALTYKILIAKQGSLLQRREQNILQIVTHEQE